MARIEDRWRDRHGNSTKRDGIGKRWRVCYVDPEGRERKPSFARKLDAERFRAQVAVDMGRGEWVDPTRQRATVGEWAERWYATTAHRTPKTRASYRSLLDSRVLPRWQNVPLGGVEYAAVAEWVADLSADGLSGSRVRQAYHVLTATLDLAAKSRHLIANPARGVSLPPLARSDMRLLTHDQLHALAAAASDGGVMILLMAYCGLRWGEAAAIRVLRVDLLRRRIEIAATIGEIGGKVVMRAGTKTHRARMVPLSPELAEQVARACEGKAPDDLLFTSPRGEPLRYRNWRRSVFDLAREAVGLDGLTPHHLRHTFASLALAEGASVKAVQHILGHSSATTTLDRYGHLLADELDEVAVRMSRSSRTQNGPIGTADVVPIKRASR